MSFHKKGRAAGDTPYAYGRSSLVTPTATPAVPCPLAAHAAHAMATACSINGKGQWACMATHPVEDAFFQSVQVEQAPVRVQNAREVAALHRSSFHAPSSGAADHEL